MASATYALYTKRTRGKAVCVKTLPPIDANLAYHIRRAHYQVMLWKAADQQIRPAVDIAAYGWDQSVVQGVCQLHALQEDQQLPLPTFTFSLETRVDFVPVLRHPYSSMIGARTAHNS